MTLTLSRAAVIEPRETCPHTPTCPAYDAPDHDAARTVAAHPEQGWSRLCNGVVVFEDEGEILPDGSTVAPHNFRPPHRAPQVALDLRAAAELLRTDGWFQMQPCRFEGGGRNCALSALDVTTRVDGRHSPDRYDAALALLEVRVDVGLYAWNDADGRTLDDVLELLESCAADAEAGAR